MKTWIEITKVCKEFIGYYCDNCSLKIEEKDLITVKIEDAEYHFCCLYCLNEFSTNELIKEE